MPRPTARRPPAGFIAALFVAGVALTGCATASGDAAPGSRAGATAEIDVSGELTIFAAASLAPAFDELAAQFEQRHPSLDIAPISYDGSSTLATQLVEGAPADVFASADGSTMQRVVDAGLAADPQLFASNTLVIAVPAGNPAGITGVADLEAPDVTVVLCAPEVPCGAASATLLERNEVVVTPASLEQNVTAVVTKVAAGEADAGLVYITDARRTPQIDAVEAAGSADIVNRYPIAALSEAGNPAAAAAFVDYVLSAEGRAVLDGLGFGAP